MNTIPLLLKAVSLVVAMLVSHSAFAANYIVYNNQPLIMVSDKREFLPFALGSFDDARGRYAIDKKVARTIANLWYYDAGREPGQTSAKVEHGYIGCDEGLVVNAGYSGSGFLSTKPLPVKIGPTALPQSLVDQSRRLFAATLRKYKLSAPLPAGMINKLEVTSVALGRGKREALVMTAKEETPEHSAMAFLIAMPKGPDGYVVSREDVREGSASDSEGYAGYAELALHVDVDGDGIEELLVQRGAYETFDASLLRWQGNAWEEIASNGGGC